MSRIIAILLLCFLLYSECKKRKRSQFVTQHSADIVKEVEKLTKNLTNAGNIAIEQLTRHGDSDSTGNKHPLLCAALISTTDSTIHRVLRNVEAVGDGCHWAFVVYAGEHEKITELEGNVTLLGGTIARTVMFDGIMPSHCNFVAKVRLYPYLLDELKLYERVWVLDDDIDISRVNVKCLSKLLDQGILPHKPLLIAQTTLVPWTQATPFFHMKFWMKEEIRSKYPAGIVGIHWYIEQQMPIFDSVFFEWFITYVIMPSNILSAALCNNWGAEHIWCMAALDYAVRRLGYDEGSYFPCGIVIHDELVANHTNSRSIKKTPLFEKLGLESIRIMRDVFPMWHRKHVEYMKRWKSKAEGPNYGSFKLYKVLSNSSFSCSTN